MDAANLIAFFITHFQVNVIYDLGWNAAREWMLAVTGVLTGIAIAIRLTEERVAAISTQATNWVKVSTNVLLVAIAIGLYFVLADLIIKFFNAIYANIGNGSMSQMAKILDGLMTKLFQLDISVGWSVAIDSVYFVGCSLLYLFTYLILVFVIFAARVAHACLVSFAIFWGAVALPMSITVGFKSLTAWRNIVVLCLIWPIVDAFLMYLISGAFMNSLTGELSFDMNSEISLGRVVFYLMLFSIMNMFLIAVAISAPLVAQGLANGSGNVTSMIGSFAAAGVAAGGVIGKRVADGVNYAGVRGGDAIVNGSSALSNKAGSMANSLASPRGSSSLSSMKGEKGSVADTVGNNSSLNQSKGANSMANSTTSTSKSSSNKSGSVFENNLKSNLNEAANLSDKSTLENTQEIPESNMSEEIDKKKAQAKRAAIINHQKKNQQ